MIYNIKNYDSKISDLTTRVTSVESVNTTQNTKITALETKTTLNSLRLSDYVTFNSGYRAGADSFIRKYGSVVEMYLVIEGNFNAGTAVEVGTLRTYIPYSSSGSRRVPMIVPNGGLCSNASINTNNGKITVVMGAGMSGTTVMFNITYMVNQ